ncbi:hypothetical protein D9T14_08640 [Propionibacterium australiense]|nr:hypothetical protein D9T14_08640 [Propionibacterium australiense]
MLTGDLVPRLTGKIRTTVPGRFVDTRVRRHQGSRLLGDEHPDSGSRWDFLICYGLHRFT